MHTFPDGGDIFTQKKNTKKGPTLLMKVKVKAIFDFLCTKKLISSLNISKYFEIFLKIFWKYFEIFLKIFWSEWIMRTTLGFWSTQKPDLQPELTLIFQNILKIFWNIFENILIPQISVDHENHFRLLKHPKTWSPGWVMLSEYF